LTNGLTGSGEPVLKMKKCQQMSDNLRRVTTRRWSTGRARVPVHR
jgi:hypothetical protein